MYAAALIDRAQFFTGKPADITNYNWLFNAANNFRLPKWFGDLFDLIDRRSINAPRKQTFFEQPYLVEQLGKSERAIRYALRLLEKVGAIVTHRDRQNRHGINSAFFEPIPQPPAKPPRAAPPAAPPPAQMLIKVAGEVAGQKSALKDEGDLGRKNTIIKMHARAQDDDKDHQAIVDTFEQMTGSQYQRGRDGSTLQSLRGQYDLATIIIGVMLSALRFSIAQPGAKIRSLSYCRSAIAEVSKANIKNPTSYLNYLRQKARKWLGAAPDPTLH